MRVNQIGVTIYDNKPQLPANRWYEATTEKDIYKNRYKLEMNFLHKGAPIKLRSALVWPPSQLRRLSYWEQNKDFYERVVTEAEDINYQIRSGAVRAHMPALLAMPNMNESFTTSSKRRHFKWIVPEQASAVIAVRQQIIPDFYQWNLRWLAPGFEQEFVINHDCRADEVPGRKGLSTRLYKAFMGPHVIKDSLLIADPTQQVYMAKPAIDDAYEAFKIRVQYLFDRQTDLAELEAHAIMKQNQNYSDRWLQELSEKQGK